MDAVLRQALLDAEQAAARYTLAAPRRAPMGSAGSQLGRLAGASLEFMDHREYQPGDDLRRLDWAAYARTDKLVVKLYRQEVCPHVDILLDGSRSMALAGTPKAAAAAGLAAAVSTAAENSGYSHALWAANDGCRDVDGGTGRPAAWGDLAFDARTSVADSFRLRPPRWRPQGLRVLVSDLLWLGDPLELLQAMADRAAAAVVLQVLAEDDVEPPGRGNVRLLDSETDEEEELFLDAAAQNRYRENLRRHQQNWHLACRQVGAVFVPLVAETLCRDWDLTPLVAQEVLTV